MATENKILSVRDLEVVFDGRKALTGVTFDVSEKEGLAIIGPNGSGKSVLLKALIGALPYRGSVVWAPGVKIGYVPQRIDLERDLPLTLRDFLFSKARIDRISEKAVFETMKLVKLDAGLLDVKLGGLSGGQFQRALIVSALLGAPNVLLFDEPTASVDLPGEEQIYDTIHRLQDERGLTLILVSHDLSLIYSKATMVLCLNKQVVCFGVPHHVLTDENLHHLYGERVLYHHHHDKN